MSGLRNITSKIGYGPQDDRLRDFFIPAMAASVRYDLAAGYFSSTMLAVAAAGLTKLILNGGKMRMLCGTDLSEADVEAIRKGHALLEERLAERMKMRLVLPESDYVENRLKVLAWLIGTGQLEIKVVLPTDVHGQRSMTDHQHRSAPCNARLKSSAAKNPIFGLSRSAWSITSARRCGIDGLRRRIGTGSV